MEPKDWLRNHQSPMILHAADACSRFCVLVMRKSSRLDSENVGGDSPTGRIQD
jgi:hypothetical protein